jgi:hypothetical protein
LGVERDEQIGIAGGHQQTRARPQNIEGLGVLGTPQIVEDKPSQPLAEISISGGRTRQRRWGLPSSIRRPPLQTFIPLFVVRKDPSKPARWPNTYRREYDWGDQMHPNDAARAAAARVLAPMLRQIRGRL